jgi:hypothetical protein
MLEDVVRGSPLHHVDGKLFDQRTGDKYEWNFRTQLMRQRERRRSVKTRDGVVGYDDVEAALAQSIEKLGAGVDSMSLAGNPTLPKHGGDEFGVGLIVFKMQEAYGILHKGPCG